MSGWDEKDDGQPTPVSETRNGERPIGDGDTLVFGVEASPAPEFGFDYAGFEEALDHISREEQAAKPEPTKVADAPVERQTLPRRVHPDDVTHTIRPVGKFSYVTMQGRVNEGFDGEALGQQLRGNAVIFDLAEVDRITSFGVRGWLRMLQTANLGEAYFVRCSESVVNQITMIHNFCGPARVHSLVAPYLCASCGAEFGVVYDAVRDATVLRGRRPPEVSTILHILASNRPTLHHILRIIHPLVKHSPHVQCTKPFTITMDMGHLPKELLGCSHVLNIVLKRLQHL